MKKFGFIMLMTAFVAFNAKAQTEVETTLGADVVSQYIWRGQELGSISLQPTLGISYSGFSLSGWGNVGISEPSDTKEFDITASYTVKNFNIGICDYWFSTPNEKYFAYKAHSTSHIFEANIGYDFNLLSLQWYTNIGGNDGLNKSGKRAYSSFVEATAPFSFASCSWEAKVGAVPYATSSYSKANKFAITVVALKASKEIKISDTFTVPIFASIVTNPRTEKAYFVVGLTISR